MTQFRDAAHVNSARLAVALAERGYLTTDQAAQMCDGKVSLQNYGQAREALRAAMNNSDGNSAYLAQMLGQQLGVALKVQVQAERLGYSQRGETVREGQGDAMRDMFSSAIEQATAQANGGVVDEGGCFGNGGVNNGGFNNGIDNGGFNNGVNTLGVDNGMANGCDYNACGTASTSPLAALAAFAVGGLIGSQLGRRNNNWDDQWGNGWMNRVPRQRVIVERVVERNPAVPTFQAPMRQSPPISRPQNDRVLRPPPSITQRPPPVSRPPAQRQNPPVQQRHPHDPVRSPSNDPTRTRH